MALKYLKLDKRVVDKISTHRLDHRKAVELSSLDKKEQRKEVRLSNGFDEIYRIKLGKRRYTK